MNKINIYISILLLLILITIILLNCPKKQKEKYNKEKPSISKEIIDYVCLLKDTISGVADCTEGEVAQCFLFILKTVVKILHYYNEISDYLYDYIINKLELKDLKDMAKDEDFGKDLLAIACDLFGVDETMKGASEFSEQLYSGAFDAMESAGVFITKIVAKVATKATEKVATNVYSGVKKEATTVVNTVATGATDLIDDATSLL